MPIFTPTQKDLDRGYLFDVDWYRVRIKSVGEKPSNDGGSINYPVEGIILMNASNGTKVDSNGITFEGKSIEWNFNSKAMGFCVGYLKALGVDVEAGQRYELKESEGHEIDVMIERGEYKGAPKNEIKHKYRKPVV